MIERTGSKGCQVVARKTNAYRRSRIGPLGLERLWGGPTGESLGLLTVMSHRDKKLTLACSEARPRRSVAATSVVGRPCLSDFT